MEGKAVQPAKAKVANAVVATQERHIPLSAPSAGGQAPLERKPAGYGMPCAKCRLYYPADMAVCPICKSPERVSPTELASAVPVAPIASQTPAALQEERERYLKELKSQVFASHTQINAAATFRCALEQNHAGNAEPAAICHSCYGEVRQQADRLEAALHMDVKEAAQIVYSAVWSDTSDPNKTYINAANALLSELRKRAGVGLLLGSNQPLAH
jgi:hypothetical protein